MVLGVAVAAVGEVLKGFLDILWDETEKTGGSVVLIYFYPSSLDRWIFYDGSRS